MKTVHSSYKLFGQFGMLVFFNLIFIYMLFQTLERSRFREISIVAYLILAGFILLFLTLLITQCPYNIIRSDGITIVNPILPFLRKMYKWTDFDYYMLIDEYSRAGNYEAIWLVKDRKLKHRISKAYYSNYAELKKQIKIKKRRKIHYGKVDQLLFTLGTKKLDEPDQLIRQMEANGIDLKNTFAESSEENLFWEAIFQTNPKITNPKGVYNAFDHIDNIVRYLSVRSIEEQIAFEKTLQKKLRQLYTPEIAELYTIVEGRYKEKQGIYNYKKISPNDNFLYFRCWLILKGEDFINDITSDIQSYANPQYSFDTEREDVPGYAEALVLVADHAYSIHHANDTANIIRDTVYILYPENCYEDDTALMLDREPKSGTDLQTMYPRLIKMIAK